MRYLLSPRSLWRGRCHQDGINPGPMVFDSITEAEDYVFACLYGVWWVLEDTHQLDIVAVVNGGERHNHKFGE